MTNDFHKISKDFRKRGSKFQLDVEADGIKFKAQTTAERKQEAPTNWKCIQCFKQIDPMKHTHELVVSDYDEERLKHTTCSLPKDWDLVQAEPDDQWNRDVCPTCRFEVLAESCLSYQLILGPNEEEGYKHSSCAWPAGWVARARPRLTY